MCLGSYLEPIDIDYNNRGFSSTHSYFGNTVLKRKLDFLDIKIVYDRAPDAHKHNASGIMRDRRQGDLTLDYHVK